MFIVKHFIDADEVISLRNKTFEWGINTEASWHPVYDNCPDYHRLHDNYPKAYVKQKFHGFYYHPWFESNKSLFKKFEEIYHLKNFLGEFEKENFINNIPSQGVIARLNLHHYPRGGGYQMEHIDPANDFAKIQTLIIASQFGKDYKSGGVYARKEINGVKYYVDEYTEIGDLLVLSPDIPHGVEPIDIESEYSWQTNDGRWVILPLFLYSDYENPNTIKPRQLG